MNEKIKELALELVEHCDWNPPHDPEYYTFAADDLEKFAELIVRECAQISEDDITDGDACCTNTACRIARQIRKHFGVEE